MNGPRRTIAVVISLAMFMLTACTLGTRPQLDLQVGTFGLHPSGPYVDDFAHLRAVDSLVHDWKSDHELSQDSSERPALLWTGDLDGRTISIVKVALGKSFVTLQIIGERSQAVVDRVVQGGSNDFVYPIAGLQADRLLVTSYVKSLQLNGKPVRFSYHLSEPIVTPSCALDPLTIGRTSGESTSYLIRPTDTRLAHLWTLVREPGGTPGPVTDFDLCAMAGHGQLPVTVGKVGVVSLSPSLAVAVDGATLTTEKQTVTATIFEWRSGLGDRGPSTVRVDLPTGEFVWSRADPAAPPPTDPQLLPIRLGGTDYVIATWQRGDFSVKSAVGFERVSIRGNIELWRSTDPSAQVTFASPYGATITRTLPPP